jgi:hypothetical protein
MTTMPATAFTTGPQASCSKHSVLVHVADEFEALGAARVTLAHVGEDTDAISKDDDVIGYICSVGRVFVALAGARLDRAEECAQSQLWDKAAEQLLREAGAL